MVLEFEFRIGDTHDRLGSEAAGLMLNCQPVPEIPFPDVASQFPVPQQYFPVPPLGEIDLFRSRKHKLIGSEIV